MSEMPTISLLQLLLSIRCLKRFVVVLWLLPGVGLYYERVLAAAEKSIEAESVPPLVSVEDALRAWEQRHARIESADVSWTIERTPGGNSSTYQMEFGLASSDSEEVARNGRFRLRGDKRRYDSAHWHLDPHSEFAGFVRDHSFQRLVECLTASCEDCDIRTLQPYQIHLTWDGKSRTELITDTGNNYSVARITPHILQQGKRGEYSYFHGLLCRPLLQALRPLTRSDSRLTTAGIQLTARPSRIGGHLCSVLEEKPTPQTVCKMWVDPQRDFCVLRAITTTDGILQHQFDIEYLEDDTFGWLPSKWSVMVSRFDESFPGQQHTFQFAAAQVSNWAINGQLEPSVFELEFPTGTIIHDVSSSALMVVDEGEQTRPVSPKEAQELLEPRPKVVRSDTNPSITWRVYVGMTTVAVACVFIIFRRKRQKRFVTGA